MHALGQEASRRPQLLALWAVGLLALGLAYRDLLTLGSRYGEFGAEVEFWLFVPNDRAPLVVLVLAAWLALRRWPRLEQQPVRSAPLWLVVGVLSLAALWHAWAIHVRVQDLQAISLMVNLAGLVLLGWGVAGLRVMWLPIAFLLFCLPIPAPTLVSLLWEMRLWTAEYAGWLLYLIGVPSYISGEQILRATESFQVIEGCSGLRSVETLTMLVVLLVELFHRRGLHAVLLLVSAPFVAFALNGVRVLTLVLNPHSELAGIHSVQGIAILLLGLLAVYGFDGVLARLLPHRPLPETADSPDASRRAFGGARLAAALLGVSLFVASMSLWVPVWGARRPPLTLEKAVGEALGDWGFTEIKPERYFLGQTRFREIVHRSYAIDRASVAVFVGTSDMRDRGTSIISRIVASPGSGWEIRDRRSERLMPDGPQGISLIAEKGTEKRLVYYWLVGTEGVLIETLRSFVGLERSEFRRSHGQLAVRLSTRITGDSASERARAARELEIFYRLLEPALRTAQQPTRLTAS